MARLAKKRAAMLVELTRMAKGDRDVLMVVNNAVASYGVEGIEDLARRRPKDFDLLFAGLQDLEEQAPAEEFQAWLG